MNAIDFISADYYVVLPRSSDPKVFLAIDDKAIIKLAFSLYNPFSLKARVLKRLVAFLSIHTNGLVKQMFAVKTDGKSNFINHLEEQLKSSLTSSVYLATAKDKVVLQLQNQGHLVGYLKYPISTIGQKRLANEAKAIAHLASLNLIPNLILNSKYKGNPYILLEAYEGNIGPILEADYIKILESFKTQIVYKLRDHPRILELSNRLEENGLLKLRELLKRTIAASNKDYRVVFEHGDFAPWNMITTKKGIFPFDFEYASVVGLDYLDEIKYHFQCEHLLNRKKGLELIKEIRSKIQLEEFGVLFRIFLIKEIVVKQIAKDNFEFESLLLEMIGIEKT